MKASELRVGNLVMDGHDVEVVNYRMIEMLVKNQAEFDFIPLTEKWLLKFGFEKYQFMNGFFIKTKFGHLMIQFYKDEIHLFFTDVTSDSIGMKFNGRNFIRNKKSFTDCKYIHQLQNLYFALTGEELTFKSE